MSGVIAFVAGSQEIWATLGEGKTNGVTTLAEGWTAGARSSQYARTSFASYSRMAEAHILARSNGKTRDRGLLTFRGHFGRMGKRRRWKEEMGERERAQAAGWGGPRGYLKGSKVGRTSS